MDVETAHDMLAWPHSGFHVHDGVWVAADDREFAVRLARYCARNPVALSRLEYWSDDATLTYHSDKPTGPTAGSETVDVLEFLARVVSHIPNKGQVLQRYYGWYANRTRGIRRRAGAHEQPPAVEAESVPLSLPEARRRWAEHRRLHYPAPSDRPDSHPPAAHRDGAPPLARAAAALDFSPHRHLGVSRSPPPPDPWVRGLLGCARAGWWPWPCLIPAARLARGC